jgi:hypothetical protein
MAFRDILDDLADKPTKVTGPLRREIIVEKKTGRVRQAGATHEGKLIENLRRDAEQDLYYFSWVILDMWWLSPSLHPPVCQWLQTVPPYRKMLMMPRNHGKSCLVGQAMPLHMFVQPKDTNLYYPGQPGTNTRILMVGESQQRACDHLGVIASNLMGNDLLRGLWPHVVWDNPRRQARRWSGDQLDLPREREFPDPSLRGIGVGTTVVGAHPNCMIKDDITTEDAANFPIIMQRAISWHDNSRALLEKPDTDLEFITCTRWAVGDLPDHVMQDDATVEVNSEWRAMIEGGKIIYPEKFGFEGAVDYLKKQHGVMFPLLYFNSIADSMLTDFSESDLREFELQNGKVCFYGNELDAKLEESLDKPTLPAVVPDLRGIPVKDALPWLKYEYLKNVRNAGRE